MQLEASGVGQKPSQRPEQRCLTAAVGAQKANPIPGQNRERQTVQNGRTSQFNAEAIGGKHWQMFGRHGNRMLRG